ncbi:hypothetical protein [Flavobacterium chungbukense]|uniref:Uncharacterized protein n=1 Tax=Flavobacterium chungbukense TaxID=877464 RepID=A0ABP7YIZ9_9FLAO|nr:hypothetical protein [Flavobacterium chungbukense]MCC4920129.1 hypothetical protein [Flavobacterium chungbukense]
MKPIIKYLILTLFSTQINFAQTFDPKLISKDSEIYLTETKKRGIEKNGVIYLVEENLKTISAYKNKKTIWQTNVISICGKPQVGETKIRSLKYDNTKLHIVFGKHSFAEVDIKNGLTKFIGED